MVDDTGVFELDDTLVKLTGHNVPEFYDTEAEANTPCLYLKAARIREGMSKLTETQLEFISKDRELALDSVLGQPMNIELYDDEGEIKRRYNGVVVAAQYLGPFQKYAIFSAEIRPWFWFLTKTEDCRVFQNLNTMDIVTQIFGDHGFSDYQNSTTGTYAAREYTIQYNESDYDFICRLLEEEGIYFYFSNEDNGVGKLVLTDDSGAHQAVPGGPAFKFYRRDEDNRRYTEHLYDWSGADRVTTGKVTYRDYNFTTSTADLTGETAIEKGTHSYKSFEIYNYPGHHPDADAGTARARARAERNAISFQVRRGASNIKAMTTGQTFTIDDHPNGDDTTEYLLIGMTHEINIGASQGDQEAKDPLMGNRLEFKGLGKDLHRCVFDCVPKLEPFRPPRVTPWPKMPSIMSAKVVGPDGDEIHTDEYGRIKVQFHWDREGENNEHSCCFIRTVMPWTGKDWGMISIPRIGSEVVISFMDGNPDQPVCTGMVYNDQYMPPYALDANKTMTGIKTRSTPGGNADTFHELVFEDKFEEEYVRFQSERDYFQIIKNNAEITIGLEHNDEGNLTQTIKNHKTETIQEGDNTFTIETGSQFITIETDQEETIRGQSTRTVTGDNTQTVEEGNHSLTVSQGNYSDTVSTGNHEVTVSQGNKTETVSLGDYNISVSAGTLTIEAGMKIELKVGANSITIDQSGVTVDGIAVAVNGTATLDAGSPMTTVSGDGILTLSGGLTKIN